MRLKARRQGRKEMSKKLGFNPWLSMWTKPRETIQKIVEIDPNYRLAVLSGIYGFISLLGSFQTMSLGYKFNFFLIIIAALILAPLWGYVIFSVVSYFVYFTGRWIGGKAIYKEVRSSFAWSNAPMTVNVILWVVMGILFGQTLFLDFPGGNLLTQNQVGILFAILLAQLIISVWILVLFVNALSQVQKFSIAKSVLNLIMSVVFLGVIMLVIRALLSYVLR